jgi:hypothetical protein
MGPSFAPYLRVWHLLVLAFLARFVAGMLTDSALQPDEVMQYLEQAHRLVFGTGVIPWEYDYGTRSWLPALLIAGVLEVVKLLHFDTPQVYQPVVKAMLCAASLAVPYGAYRLTRAVASEDAAWFALIFTSFWYELVSYGHRSTIDAMAAYPAFAALALVWSPPRLRTTLACGALLGLSFVLRFQLGPSLTMIGCVALWRWRMRAAYSVGAALVIVVLGGALDAYTWGSWFASIVNSIQYNLGLDLARRFGTQPAYWYIRTTLALSGGLVLVGALGLLLHWRRCWPLLAVALVTTLYFSAVAHKETRFVFLLIPLWLIGLAVLLGGGDDPAGATMRGFHRGVSMLSPLVVVAFFVVSAVGLLDRLPFARGFTNRHLRRDYTRQAYRLLATERDVVAVLDISGSNGWYLTPYYDLHQNVPLYYRLVNGYQTVRLDPRRYVSHAILPAADPGPPGFRPLRRIGPLEIWRRVADPRFTPEPDGYEPRVALLQPVPTPPTVTPRW